jgi:hypothetical protein
MRRKSVAAGLIPAMIVCGLGTAAAATETITYIYDAKGRLVRVERTGTVNNGVTTTYSHDKADNRTNVTVTGSSSDPGSGSGSCTQTTAAWGSATYGCFRWGQ